MKKRPLDPFERHELVREATFQRTQREKISKGRKPRREPTRSRAANSTLESRVPQRTKNSRQLDSSELRDTLMRLHSTSRKNGDTKGGVPVNISELVKESRSKFVPTKEHRPAFLNYADASNQLCMSSPTNELSSLLNSMFQSFVGWYADNRFDFMIPELAKDSNHNHVRGTSSDVKGALGHDTEVDQGSSRANLLQVLRKKRYEPRHLLNHPPPAPTHSLIDYSQIGPFLLSASVSNLASFKEQAVLLAAPSLAINLKRGNKLVLPSAPDCNVTLSGKETGFFTTWHVYYSP